MLIKAMRSAAAKHKKDDLRQYFKESFRKDQLPGDLTVGANQFKSELNKVKGPKRPGGSLKEKIKISEMNVKNVSGGKDLMSTF